MAKLTAQWTAQEMQNIKKHGYYARPVFRGTMTFEEFCNEVLADTTFNPKEVIGAFRVLQEKGLVKLSQGIRLEIGEDFITLLPNCIESVMDYEDKDGNLIVAKPEDLKTKNLVSRIGCLVNAKFKKLFEKTVEWTKVNKKGESVEPIDDATQGNENITDNQPSSIDTSTGTADTSTGSNPGGDDIPTGNG